MANAKVITLFNKFPALKKAVTGATLMKSAMAGGLVLQGFARLNASRGRPGLEVDTGLLVNSIETVEGQQTETYAEAEIGTGVEYAEVHEMGNQDTPARPYLRPAADEHQPEIGQAVMEQLKGDIEQAVR